MFHIFRHIIKLVYAVALYSVLALPTIMTKTRTGDMLGSMMVAPAPQKRRLQESILAWPGCTCTTYGRLSHLIQLHYLVLAHDDKRVFSAADKGTWCNMIAYVLNVFDIPGTHVCLVAPVPHRPRSNG